MADGKGDKLAAFEPADKLLVEGVLDHLVVIHATGRLDVEL